MAHCLLHLKTILSTDCLILGSQEAGPAGTLGSNHDQRHFMGRLQGWVLFLNGDRRSTSGRQGKDLYPVQSCCINLRRGVSVMAQPCLTAQTVLRHSSQEAASPPVIKSREQHTPQPHPLASLSLHPPYPFHWQGIGVLGLSSILWVWREKQAETRSLQRRNWM